MIYLTKLCCLTAEINLQENVDNKFLETLPNIFLRLNNSLIIIVGMCK